MKANPKQPWTTQNNPKQILNKTLNNLKQRVRNVSGVKCSGVRKVSDVGTPEKVPPNIAKSGVF